MRIYAPGTEFQIGRIDMVGNTGTYLDSPFHRYADGDDLSGLRLEQLADLDGRVVRRPFENGLAVDADAFKGLDVAGKAVLIHTGWSRHWRTDDYYESHPFLTEDAARFLAGRGATLVGIDSHNIDDTRTRARPVHTVLLAGGTLICEHLCRLEDSARRRLPLSRSAAEVQRRRHVPGARVHDGLTQARAHAAGGAPISRRFFGVMSPLMVCVHTR